jgi:methylated-DNA-[protein]-cysteine S-methyltransferase
MHEENPMIVHPTPFGPLSLAASNEGLTRVTFRPSRRPSASPSPSAATWLELARHELDAYFAGALRTFTVPVDLSRVDTAHRIVLQALTAVGFGETVTYGGLASAAGLVEDGPRKVGGAMARNPVLIVVPCHRVLGVGGKLTGYSGGLAVKRRLLDLEARDLVPQLALAL